MDKISLSKESCQIKKRHGIFIHMKKGDKLIRSLKQIFQVNYDRIRNKISMCRAAKHFECIIMLKKLTDLRVGEEEDEEIRKVKEETIENEIVNRIMERGTRSIVEGRQAWEERRCKPKNLYDGVAGINDQDEETTGKRNERGRPTIGEVALKKND